MTKHIGDEYLYGIVGQRGKFRLDGNAIEYVVNFCQKLWTEK